MVERRSYDAFGKIRAMDYGTNNNTFANRVIETTRAYTGHEQIAELSGLVHMNARVYDSDIGRFLSADTIIQAPHDSQSYNRYSYVRNNPLMYTDPSGHSWFSKLWKKIKKHIRTIAAIAIAAVIAIYAPGLLVQAFSSGSWGGVTFSAFGTTTAMGTQLSLAGVMAVGAMAGFASGAIMTGSLEGALQGALWGAVSAGVAFGVGHSSMFKSMYDAAGNTKEVVRALAHGLSRGIISMAQGGTFKSGFASGFSASFFSPGTTVGGDGAGGFGLRTSIAAIAGGTASALGGGKFSNGAISGAFVHMFNAEGLTLKQSLSKLWTKLTDGTITGDIAKGFEGGLEGYRQVRDGTNPKQPMITRIMLKSGMTAIETGLTAGVKNPVAEIWLDTVSGVYFDTYAYKPVSIMNSQVNEVLGNDTSWF